MQINCLIVDDEPLSQDVIKDFVEASHELSLVGVCNNALEAATILNERKIDLLFLDINMPRLSGISLVKSLPNPPLFVFVTAYPEFAVEGFEVDAVDYLLKPVSFERFRKAVSRVISRIEESTDSASHIMVKADKKNYRLDFDEILYLEAMGDYVKFILPDKKLMVHGTMKNFLQSLPDDKFIRIHKSYSINKLKVDYVEANLVKVGEHKLPVSLTYKEELRSKLNSRE